MTKRKKIQEVGEVPEPKPAPKEQLRNKKLSEFLHEQCQDYLAYEYEDMLMILAAGIEKLIQQDKEVMIDQLGKFYPYQTHRHYTKHPRTGKWMWFDGHTVMKFRPSETLTRRFKALRGDKIKAKDEEE